MDDGQKQQLLRLARDTVEAVVAGGAVAPVQTEDPDLLAARGCFVTLKNGGQLRGCIGQFHADRPLVELVVEMAKASATADPRFVAQPIERDELAELEVELSVLSPLERTDDPLSMELGVHGVYIRKGCASGCFLPQVAEETGWSKEQFLSYCCSHKAGLDPDAWADPSTEVYLFTAEVFGARFSDL